MSENKRKNKTNLKSTKNYVFKIKKSIKTRYKSIVIEPLLNMFEAVSTRYFLVGHQIILIGEFNYIIDHLLCKYYLYIFSYRLSEMKIDGNCEISNTLISFAILA